MINRVKWAALVVFLFTSCSILINIGTGNATMADSPDVVDPAGNIDPTLDFNFRRKSSGDDYMTNTEDTIIKYRRVVIAADTLDVKATDVKVDTINKE